MQFCTTMIRVYIFPLCYIIVSVDTYIVLTCHSSCCDSFNNLLAKRIRQWPNWPGLDISAYFSVCVPFQLQKIKKPGKMVLKIESHSTAMGLLSCIALLMGFTTGVPGDSCSQMT